MSGIVIHRSRHAQEYVILPNYIVRDNRLSFLARGLLAMLLSLPPDWHVTTDVLAQDNPESREKIRAGMRELRAASYVQLRTERGKDGRTRRWLEVFDTPQPNAVRTAFGPTSTNTMFPQVAPNAGKPAVGSPADKKKYGPKYGGSTRGGTQVPPGPPPTPLQSHKRDHDGPEPDGPDDQQIPIEVQLQSQATDRNAREDGQP